MSKDTKITKVLSSAAMAAMMVSPTAAFAANSSTFDDPNGGAPILIEHPLDAEQHVGNNNTMGAGSYQGIGASKENIAYGTDVAINKAAGTTDASFDTAIGHEAKITGSAGTAVGAAAQVDSKFGGSAYGAGAKVQNGQLGTAIGTLSTADGNFATAVGANATAQGTGTEAIGANAKATGENATALGVGAQATASNSVALGNGSIADEDDTVSVGKAGATRKLTNVTAGVADTDGVNVSQLKQGLAGKADIDLSNINDAGKQVIKDLAQTNVSINSSSGSITVNKEIKNSEAIFDINLAKDQNFDNVTTKNLNVTGNTVIGTNRNDTLTVNATTNLKNGVNVNGTANFKDDVIIGSDASDTLTINATTNLKNDINVDGNADFRGDMVIGTDEGNILTVNSTTNLKGGLTVDGDAVFNKNVEFKGSVNADSYSVGGDVYISQDGINANNHKVINVADGTIAAGSKDAVNGGQLYDSINDVRNDLKSDMDKATGRVGAQAAAMSALHPLEYDKDNKFSVAAAVGSYKSEAAGALGAFYRPDDKTVVALQGTVGSHETMVGVGYAVKFGHSHKDDAVSAGDNGDVQAALDDLRDKYDQLLQKLSDQSNIPASAIGGFVVPGDGNMMSRVRVMLDQHDADIDAAHNSCEKAAPFLPHTK